MHDRLMIIGAAGDLTSRYLLPALVRLQNDGLLPENLTIDAISQEVMSDDKYRRKLEGPLAAHSAGVDESARTAILQSISHDGADEAEESWRIVEPVVDAWSEGLVPLRSYPAGTSFEP